MDLYAGTISAFGDGDIRHGRVDSPALSALKDGVTVSVSVSYDLGGTSASGINSTLYSRCSFGTDTREGGISASDGIQTEACTDDDPGTDGNYGYVPFHKSVDLQNVTKSNRLTWRSSYTYNRGLGGSITGKTVYVYIDNIKVSIKNN